MNNFLKTLVCSNSCYIFSTNKWVLHISFDGKNMVICHFSSLCIKGLKILKNSIKISLKVNKKLLSTLVTPKCWSYSSEKLINNTLVNCKFILCISTSFQVLAAPESWSNYFFSAVFNHFCSFQTCFSGFTLEIKI